MRPTGIPGFRGSDPKTAAQLIGRYGALEDFPPESLRGLREDALLFKRLATLRSDAPLFDDVDAHPLARPDPGLRGGGRDESATRGSCPGRRHIETLKSKFGL